MTYIIDSQIDSLTSYLSKNIQKMLQNMPSFETNPDDHLNFLKTFWENNASFKHAMSGLASLSKGTPLKSFEQFIKLLPIINLNNDSPPINQSPLVMQLKNVGINWKSQGIRIAIANYSEMAAAVFLQMILNDVDEIYDAAKILSQIKQQEQLNITMPEFYENYRIMVVDVYKISVYYISKSIPLVTFKSVCDFINNEFDANKIKTNDEVKLVNLIFYSRIVCNAKSNETCTCTKKLPTLVKYANSILKKKLNLHNAIYEFLSNFIIVLCNIDPSFASSSTYYDLYKASSAPFKTIQYAGTAYKFITILYSFAKNKKISSGVVDPDFIESHIYSKKKPYISIPEHTKRCLEDIIILIKGKSYVSVKSNKNETSFNYDHLNSNVIDLMFDIVVKQENQSIYTNVQSLLTEFITVIAGFDIYNFINKKINIITNSSFISYNGVAVFEAVKIFIFPHYNFQMNDNHRDKFKTTFRECALKFMNGCESLNDINDLFVYNMLSLVDSITLHKNNLNKALLYILEESEPHEFVPVGDKLIPTFIQKYKKLISQKSVKIFDESNFNDIKKYDSLQKHELNTKFNVLKSALSIIPFAIPDQLTVNDVLPHIFSNNPYVSSTAIRVCQALVHIDIEFANSVLENLSILESKFFMESRETLYISIKAIYLLLESYLYCYKELPEKFYNFFNFVIILALCAPWYVIRKMGIKIAQFIKRQKNSNKSILSIIEERSDIISSTASNNLLVAIEYRKYTENLQPISFIDMMSSKRDQMYQFYIAAFAKQFIACSFNISDTQKMLMKLLNSVIMNNSQKSTNSLFKMNLMIFLFNSINNTRGIPELSKFLNLYSNFDTNKEYQYAQYALLSCISNDTSLDLIELVKTEKLAEEIYFAFLYSFRLKFDSNEFQKTDDELSNISIFLVKLFHIFELKGFSTEAITFTEAKCDPYTEAHLIEFFGLCNVFFNKVYERLQETSGGPFLKYSFRKFSIDLHVNQYLWLNFFINLSARNDKIGVTAKKEFANILSLFKLPSESIYTKFVNNINKYDTPEILSMFLIQYYNEQISSFIENSIDNSNYFIAISYQFKEFKSIESAEDALEHIHKAEASESEKSYNENTYANMGSLFALCFYYFLSSNKNERKAAYRIFIPLILGVSFLRNICNSESAKRIDNLLQYVNSELSNVSLEPCVQLSKALVSDFAFCSEQFVKYSMRLAQKRKSMLDILYPWIRNISFSIEQNEDDQKIPVFQLTEELFYYYTPYTFVNDLIQIPSSPNLHNIIQRVIESQTSDSIDIFKFITILLIYSISSDMAKTEKIENIFVSLYSLSPDKFLNEIIPFFTFDFYHYQQIQINGIDKYFDMDEFFQEQDESNKNGKSSHYKKFKVSNPEIDVYQETIKFLLQLLYSCAIENLFALKQISPYILMFKYIFTDTIYQNACDVLLKKLVDFNFNEKDECKKYLKKKLTEDVRNKLSIYSLAYGICCGELEYAIKGLSFYLLIEPEINDEIIDTVLKALYVISRCIYEKSNQIHVSSLPWVFRILDIPKTPNYEIALKYMNELIEILINAPPRLDVFWTVVSFLKYNNNGNAFFTNKILKLINHMLKDDIFIQKILDSPKPYEFSGLLPLIVDINFDKETPSLIFDIIHLSSKNHSLIYSLNESDNVFTILTILIDVIQGKQIKEADDSLQEIVKNISSDAQNILIKFISQIIKVSKDKKFDNLYDFCSGFKQKIDNKETISYFVNAIVLSGLNNSHSLNCLLQSLNINDFNIKVVERTSKFPIIYFQKEYKFNEKINQKISVYSHPSLFPPLVNLDLSYITSPFVNEINKYTSGIMAKPFTEHAEMIFKAESIVREPVNLNIYKISTKINHNPQDKSFYDSFKKNLQIKNELHESTDFTKETKIALQKSTSFSKENSTQFIKVNMITDNLSIVNSSLFIPNNITIDFTDFDI